MKKTYYFGFYRDYTLKGRPVICLAVESIDCLSCELLGGDYPLVDESLSHEQMKKYAFHIAAQYKTTYLEISGGRRRRIA